MAGPQAYSTVGPDFKDIVAGIVADVQSAWPDIEPRNITVDVLPIELSTSEPYAVIVPGDIVMEAGAGNSSVHGVLQVFSFTVYGSFPIADTENVPFAKVDRADALIQLLMASIRYKGTYELPFVPRVGMTDPEPSRARMILEIEFTTRCENWRYDAKE